ncbi:MAG: bifunctional phosphopantothenoylcysteine decarboxylase/phosphopantothenate--cysteine ligase CoaBC [Synechococcus sp. NP17]|nr:bifunctional phosphopantothenoylcysteine decarboxylase/phosphopantothenate--cysteine ligase CoaBC [Synechococcus sp. NP17]
MKIEASRPLEGRRLLVAASGSIAAVKTPLLVSALVKAGAQVRCVITPSAARLVSPVALASLSRHPCLQDEDQWSPSQPRPLHVELAEWADLVVVAPLSATSLARWTQGLGDGLLASVLLACERPVVAASAMNTAMWSNTAVRRNWELLRRDERVLCLGPEPGVLACDRIGEGRMAEPALIQLAVIHALRQASQARRLSRDWSTRSLLVTAGPTVEALDAARLISNRSSGQMGVMLAQAARWRGARVDLIHGPLQVPDAWLEGLSCHPVESARDMESELIHLQQDVDAVAMAAAVADLRRRGGAPCDKPTKTAFARVLSEEMETVPDLLAGLAERRTPGQVLLGFAALSGQVDLMLERGRQKLFAKQCDLLFANPVDQPNQGFGSNPNGGLLLKRDGSLEHWMPQDKLELANRLLDEIAMLLPAMPEDSSEWQ